MAWLKVKPEQNPQNIKNQFILYFILISPIKLTLQCSNNNFISPNKLTLQQYNLFFIPLGNYSSSSNTPVSIL